MTRQLKIIIGAYAASGLVLSAFAQDTSSLKSDASNPGDRLPYGQRMNRLNDVAKANDIIGMAVKNRQGERLGDVKDLAVDLESGRVVQVIVSTGGFLGVGDTLSAVPPGAFQHDRDQKVLYLDADKEKLQNAPKFEMSKWGEYSDSEHVGKVYSYYGEQPAFGFIQSGEGSPSTVSTRKSDGTWDKDRTLSDSRGIIPSSRLAEIQRASKIIGAPVKNLQDDRLGKVENLLVDLPSGRIVTVILSSGGFLGIGDELSAIPPTAFRFTTDRDTLQLDASKELLSNAPHFKSSEWPDFNQPDYDATVYSAYHAEPYFSTTGTTTANTAQPDNSARNVRDRDDRSLTPGDQGNNKADLNTTAQIRQQIIADKALSVDAQNVKIITINGHVTLRGPVNTVDEKRRIATIADRLAGSANVDNQLEVKLTANNS
jgi:sporulation protein YlmC with PRC-barrel domain